MNRVLIIKRKKEKGKKEKNEKEKGVMWLASRLAFSFFSAWSIKLQKGTEKRSGQRRKKSGHIASHRMDPRGQIIHLTPSR
jgi:hypothetical protein